MSITLNTLAYSQDTFLTPNKVVYTGPDNTFSAVDSLTLGRTAPKPTSTFAGVGRAEAKRTKTATLGDGSTAPIIVTLSVSAPVGAAEADIDAVVDDVCDFGLSTEGKSFYKNHDMTF